MGGREFVHCPRKKKEKSAAMLGAEGLRSAQACVYVVEQVRIRTCERFCSSSRR